MRQLKFGDLGDILYCKELLWEILIKRADRTEQERDLTLNEIDEIDQLSCDIKNIRAEMKYKAGEYTPEPRFALPEFKNGQFNIEFLWHIHQQHLFP